MIFRQVGCLGGRGAQFDRPRSSASCVGPEPIHLAPLPHLRDGAVDELLDLWHRIAHHERALRSGAPAVPAPERHDADYQLDFGGAGQSLSICWAQKATQRRGEGQLVAAARHVPGAARRLRWHSATSCSRSHDNVIVPAGAIHGRVDRCLARSARGRDSSDPLWHLCWWGTLSTRVLPRQNACGGRNKRRSGAPQP